MKKIVAIITAGTFFVLIFAIPQPYSEFVIGKKQARDLQNRTVRIGAMTDTTIAGGSGVIISKKGLVLTAAHVVSDPKLVQIFIVTISGNSYTAQIVGMDKRRDLALLKISESAQKFPYAKLQVKSNVWVGQDVIVVGSPGGHPFMVSVGIISGFIFRLGYACVIGETTAYINHGSSGGPVFNTQGEVVGIVSAMYVSRFGTPLGIGIFIPIKQIRQFMQNIEPKIKEQTYPPPRLRIKDLGNVK